jgi:inhibitor of the pro-sigma K processing machinery
MAIWQYLLIIGGGLLLVFAACLLPGRFFRIFGTLALNAGLGLALLLALNLLFGETLQLPLNALTLAVSGFLGLPGVATLAVVAAL